jgi:eukaryotic-like serine/threonine-protein kinase
MKRRTFAAVTAIALSLLFVGQVFAQSAAGGRSRSRTTTYDVTITSNVRGASVYVDGQGVKGGTPVTVQLGAGDHNFRVSADGYHDYTTRVNVSKAITINAVLQPLNRELRISSNVDSAQVYINGDYKGTTSFRDQLPPGRYTIRITASGYLDYNTTISLNSDTSIRAVLEPAFATLRLSVQGSYLNPNVKDPVGMLELYVDGQIQRSTTVQVSPGRHTVRITSGGFSIEGTFMFRPGEEYIIEPRLQLNLK